MMRFIYVAALALMACSEGAPAEPTPIARTAPAPPAADGRLLPRVCDDPDEPLAVACLVGKPVSEVVTCDARALMGCPTIAGPGFATLGCTYDDGLPERYVTPIVRWSEGALTEVKSSAQTPDARAEGVEEHRSLPEGSPPGAAMQGLIAELGDAGCRLGEASVGDYVSRVEARCADVELRIVEHHGDRPRLVIRVGSAEVHDCFYAGRHHGVGTRPPL